MLFSKLLSPEMIFFMRNAMDFNSIGFISTSVKKCIVVLSEKTDIPCNLDNVKKEFNGLEIRVLTSGKIS